LRTVNHFKDNRKPYDGMERFSLDPTRLSPETPVFFPGPEGRLEGRWRPAPRGREARGVVVVAHPHPAQGGTMQNKVVFHVARTLNHDLDVASLRFNFRGVEASEGAYDAGRGEVEDTLAAWDEAARRVPGKPLLAAGFSFGAAMTLLAAARLPDADMPAPTAGAAGNGHPVPAALALVGLPVSLFPPPRASLPLPLVAVHGEADAFTPPDVLRGYLDSWPGPVSLRLIPGADHFLTGRLQEAVSFLTENLKDRL